MSLIYRDYLCSKEKQTELIELDKKELIEYKKQLRERYNTNNLFKNNRKLEPKTEIVDLPIEIKYDSVFQKIIKCIRNFFK